MARVVLLLVLFVGCAAPGGMRVQAPVDDPEVRRAVALAYESAIADGDDPESPRAIVGEVAEVAAAIERGAHLRLVAVQADRFVFALTIEATPGRRFVVIVPRGANAPGPYVYGVSGGLRRPR